MDLGNKLRTARLEAGLTQKQLCEGLVTRNMLSQIENGSAKPSMGTLGELARRLGKSVSYFLEDTAVLSPNTQVMENARSLFDNRQWEAAWAALATYQEPDPVYDREKGILEAECLLKLAELAIQKKREPYARELLQKVPESTAYCAADLNRRRLLLLGQLRVQHVSQALPGLDGELLLRARETEDPVRAAALLDACEDLRSPERNLLRGRLWLAEKKHEKAKDCLLLAEGTYPTETAPLLEECFRELGDYRKAYEYACKQRK